MPEVDEIRKTMIRQGIPTHLMEQIDFPKPDGNQPEEVLYLIEQMDKLLSPTLCLAIMEEQGCHKDEKTTAPFRAFGLVHSGKTVAERLALFDELVSPHKAPCRLNSDGTLTIFWDGWIAERQHCVCGVVEKLYESRGGPQDISITFCGCCAGHVRHTYQHALGVTLHVKEIVSSPISSSGLKRCEFLFDIVE